MCKDGKMVAYMRTFVTRQVLSPHVPHPERRVETRILDLMTQDMGDDHIEARYTVPASSFQYLRNTGSTGTPGNSS